MTDLAVPVDVVDAGLDQPVEEGQNQDNLMLSSFQIPIPFHIPI